MPIGIKIPGVGPGTGPIIPTALPSFGTSLDDYTHRFSGARLTGAIGDVISVWEDSSTSPAPILSASAGLVVAETSGARFAKKVAGTSVSTTGGPSTPYTSSGTLIVITYLDPANAVGGTRDFIKGMGFSVGRASNSNWQASGPGGYALSSAADSGGWEFVAFGHDGSTPFTTGDVIMQRGTVSSTTITGSVAPTGNTNLGIAPNVQTFEGGIAEMVYWPRKLSQAEITSVRATMMAYSPLF